MLKRLQAYCWLICLSTILFPAYSFGQSEEISKKSKLSLSQLYLECGLGSDILAKDGSAAILGTGFTLSNHWGGGIGYRNTSFVASNLPSDYKSGGLFNGTVVDDIQYWSFCV